MFTMSCLRTSAPVIPRHRTATALHAQVSSLPRLSSCSCVFLPPHSPFATTSCGFCSRFEVACGQGLYCFSSALKVLLLQIYCMQSHPSWSTIPHKLQNISEHSYLKSTHVGDSPPSQTNLPRHKGVDTSIATLMCI